MTVVASKRRLFFVLNENLFSKIFILILLVSIKNVLVEEVKSDSNENAGNDSFANWFRTALELDTVSSEALKSKQREKPPFYVQELYEIVLTDDNYVEQRFDRIGDKSLTIQAIHQEATTLENNGVTVRFALKKLWVKAERVARAELVLSVRRDMLSPNDASVAYMVNAASFAEGDFGLRPLSAFSQSLAGAGVHASTTHDRDFVVLQFGDSVRGSLAPRDSSTFVVRVSVTEKIDDGATRFLHARDIRRLFHLNSRRRMRPLLVLYSRQIDASPMRRRRRHRHNDDADDDAAPMLSASAHHASVGNCALHKWQVDLRGLLGGSVVRPSKAAINFCAGKCPYPIYDNYWNATNNAVIRNTYVATRQNSMRRSATGAPAVVVPDAVCVPRTYHPLTILYEENGNFVIKNWENVAATSCYCA